MSMSRPPAATTDTRALVSAAPGGLSSQTSSAAHDQPLATPHAIGDNGIGLLAALVAIFAVAVTAVVGAAGFRSSRRRY
jgi:hypothetical protein